MSSDFGFGMKVKIALDRSADILRKRRLDEYGITQQALDNVILQTCDPYIPFDTGMLRDSGHINTVIGSGIVRYRTPYARKQYYENRGGDGLRGKLWFERAKADHIDDWAQVVEDVSGGKVTLF